MHAIQNYSGKIIEKELGLAELLQKQYGAVFWGDAVIISVLVEAKLSVVEPSRRWAHSPSPGKAPGGTQCILLSTIMAYLYAWTMIDICLC